MAAHRGESPQLAELYRVLHGNSLGGHLRKFVLLGLWSLRIGKDRFHERDPRYDQRKLIKTDPTKRIRNSAPLQSRA